MGAGRWCAISVVALFLLAGCANLAPRPTATAAPPAAPAKPAVVPTPSPVPVRLGDTPDDVNNAVTDFVDQLLSVIDQASVMAEASCDDLKLAQTDDPTTFKSIRGYAAALKRVAAQSPDLSEDEEVKSTLADLDTVMGQLDGALSLCGISLN